MSPASDPLALAEDVAAHPEAVGASLGISFVAYVCGKTYADVVLDNVVAPTAVTLVKEAAARCTSEQGTIVTVLAGLAISRDQPLLSGDFSTGAFGQRLKQNIPQGPWAAPLLIAHGVTDEVIPIGIQEDYVAALGRGGIAVQYKTYPDRNHMGVLQPDSPLNAGP